MEQIFEGKIKVDFDKTEVLFPDGEKQIFIKTKIQFGKFKLWCYILKIQNTSYRGDFQL